MEEVFRTFCNYIKNRFDPKGEDFSEDYMRYVLFTSLLREQTTEAAKNCLLVHMDLEYPYEKLLVNDELEGKKLDMWVSRGKPEIAIECKYHRKSLQRKSSPPRTMWAGSIFEDLRRLSNIKKIHKEKVDCYFVYLSTEIMSDYLNKNHKRFFNLKNGGESWEISDEYRDAQKDTFKKQVKGKLECKITNVLDCEADKNGTKIYIKIFKVET